MIKTTPALNVQRFIGILLAELQFLTNAPRNLVTTSCYLTKKGNGSLKLFDTRDEYHNENLIAPDDDPVTIFESWYASAAEHEPNSPNAMTISTVDESGQPWSRMVLLKAFENGSFVFFTNTSSIKSAHISSNNKVCLLFYWKSLHRQVQVHGRAEPISRTEAIAYFLSRPLESQISSWVSDQSKPVESRQTLLQKLNAFRASLPSPLTAPQHWGGYRVVPQRIEFWQGAEHRLHHRIAFSRKATGSSESAASQNSLGLFDKGTILNP